MSIEWMSSVWKDPRIESQGDLLVALAIADFTNEKGLAWPSVDTIARKSRFSDRSVQRAIRSLEGKGVLKVHPQNSKLETNTYQLLPVTPLTPVNDGGDKLTPPGGDKYGSPLSPQPSGTVISGTGTSSTVPQGKGSTEGKPVSPPENLTPHEPPKDPPKEEPQPDTAFDTFWKAYPRKVGKDDARKVFARKKCASIIVPIIAAIEAQKLGVQWCKDDGRFIPHPSTWLNRGSWDDEVILAGPRGSQPPQNVDAKRIALETERKRVQAEYDGMHVLYDWDKTPEWSKKRKELKTRLMQIDGQLGALSSAA